MEKLSNISFSSTAARQDRAVYSIMLMNNFWFGSLGGTVYQNMSNLGTHLAKYCFDPRLIVDGNCRICGIDLVGSMKGQVSCALPLIEGAKSQLYTVGVYISKLREGVQEWILGNHPNDCPICDQASNCDLQDQSVSEGQAVSRKFFNKSAKEDRFWHSLIKTSMNRCINCGKCVRALNQRLAVPFLGISGRAVTAEISHYLKTRVYSEIAGTLVDYCPVRAGWSSTFVAIGAAFTLAIALTGDIALAEGATETTRTFMNTIEPFVGQKIDPSLGKLNEYGEFNWANYPHWVQGATGPSFNPFKVMFGDYYRVDFYSIFNMKVTEEEILALLSDPQQIAFAKQWFQSRAHFLEFHPQLAADSGVNSIERAYHWFMFFNNESMESASKGDLFSRWVDLYGNYHTTYYCVVIVVTCGGMAFGKLIGF